MIARRTCCAAAGLFLLATTSAHAQSEGCTALMQAGADAISGQIALEDGTIKQDHGDDLRQILIQRPPWEPLRLGVTFGTGLAV